MELDSIIFNKLISFIDDSKKNSNYELEARFWNKNKIIVNEENYKKVFQKLTFSKENNGYGFKYEMQNILDILLDKNSTNSNENSTLRMSINNINDIKKYWLKSTTENINVNFIEKEKIDKIDEENYNIRFSLNNEIPQNDILEKNKNLLKTNNSNEKTYRYKNRYSIKTDDNLFLIDMSTIKYGIGKNFNDSNTLNSIPKYEIEIEFIGKTINTDSENILKKLLFYSEIILKILQNSENLLSNTLINSIKNNYNLLIKTQSSNIDNFIAASPVTIHRENLLKNENINIFNRYAVTLKADGERNFLIVYASQKEEENGKIFIFNNNFTFIDTGLVDKEWTNTIIEGELVINDDKKDFYIYDILFSKNEDVRRKHLLTLNKDSKQISRLDLIELFYKSSSRKNNTKFNPKNIIQLNKKLYKYSIRNDGSDIFQKVNELWNTRKYNQFNVDGIIFVPIFEYYPLKGGSWYSLFKWKPPNLNTIDFLIKVLKDDNKEDIKNPYIENIERLDGKKETILKQYKTIQLYVGGKKTIFNKNRKAYKKSIPVLFNPFNIDNKNSEIYNSVKLFIDEDEKFYALDPITNEREEIYDDIIVEFGYDETKENGFKWIPYRFRKDKTNLYKNGKDVFGNSEHTANDIFRAINDPITEEMITTGKIPIKQGKSLLSNLDQKPYYSELGNENNNIGKRERFPYQNFHNHYIKYQLYYFSSPSYIQKYSSGAHGKLLDLCCGKGVDINKIKRAKYSEVVGMDYDLNNIKFAQERYKTTIVKPPNAYYVRGDSSKLIWPEFATGFTEADKIYTKKYIPTKYYFDSISLQFCFHYFYKDEIAFRSMLQNLNDNLKIGGYVIGTCFDGERIYDKLKDSESIMGKTFSGETLWKIEKKYPATKFLFSDKRANFGKVIDVFVKTIGVVHPEYLVNFYYVDKIMKEYGFSKVSLKPFEEFYNELIEGKNLMNLPEKDLGINIEGAKKMSDAEKEFSFLSSGFIYKKEKNSSDSLYKKLIELMEKRDKSKILSDDIGSVYKVDKDTEHIIEDSVL
jgi:hypothetical protein